MDDMLALQKQQAEAAYEAEPEATPEAPQSQGIMLSGIPALQVHILAEFALGSNAKAVADDQHHDHQLRID